MQVEPARRARDAWTPTQRTTGASSAAKMPLPPATSRVSIGLPATARSDRVPSMTPLSLATSPPSREHNKTS